MKDLKKTILAYQIALGLGVISLTGCENRRILDENGKIEIDNLRDDYILTINYKDNTKKYYIVNIIEPVRKGRNAGFTDAFFIDVKTGKSVLTLPREQYCSERRINKIENLNIDSYEVEDIDYYFPIDSQKTNFNSTDIDNILNDYKNSKDSVKKLVK